MSDVSADELALMNKARRLSLFNRWGRGGRLTPAELAEIQDMLPASANDASADVLPPATPPRRAHYEKSPLELYEPVFNVRVRAIKGWIATGKKAKDEHGRPRPDLPPLDHPAEMAAWWQRNMTHRVPDNIMQMAVDAAKAGGNSSPPRSDPINVSELSDQRADALRMANGYLNACDRKLAAAYAAGDDAAIQLWSRRWEKALESRSKAETAERATAKQNDEVLDKRETIAEIGSFLEVLRVMRSTMPRRIVARLGDLATPIADALAKAVELERADEDSVLRQLEVFRGIADLPFKLEPEPVQ